MVVSWPLASREVTRIVCSVRFVVRCSVNIGYFVLKDGEGPPFFIFLSLKITLKVFLNYTNLYKKFPRISIVRNPMTFSHKEKKTFNSESNFSFYLEENDISIFIRVTRESF